MAIRVRGYGIESYGPPHPNPLPNGEREQTARAATVAVLNTPAPKALLA